MNIMNQKTKFQYILGLVICSICISSCANNKYASPFDGVRNEGFKYPKAELQSKINSLYMQPSSFKDNVYLMILRSNIGQYYSFAGPIAVILSAAKVDTISCNWILSNLDSNEIQSANKLYSKYFYCLNHSITDSIFMQTFPALKSKSINRPTDVDLHMAWFSATGDRQPVDKLVWNIAANSNVCPCANWPVKEFGIKDTLFRRYFFEAKQKYPNTAQLDAIWSDIQDSIKSKDVK
jgi:hypothetical protein